MRLNQLAPGQKSTVLRFDDAMMGGKLMSMGILPGSKVELIRTMSAGKTIYVKVNGHGLALRSSEASKIMLQANTH